MLLSKESHWGWGGGSEVKSTCCSPQGLSSVQDTLFWEGKEMRKAEEETEGKGERKGKRKWRRQEETRLSFSGELGPTETN